VLTALLRRYALKKNLIDIPNERSSHMTPVPRGGGVAIVASFYAGIFFLFVQYGLALFVSVGLAGAGLLVASVGFLDDHGHVSAKWRLLIHFIAIGWALAWFGKMPEAMFYGYAADLGWLGYIIVAVTLVWLLNLFNFMDGIDGIASSEAIFIASSGLFLVRLTGHADLELVAMVLIGSTTGFLIWNWPPAKIFMGDVGSGFLGVMLGIYAYWTILVDAVSFWSWMIIFGVFIVDATLTLIRRFIGRKAWYMAHRTHAYQHAAHRWGHLYVTLVVTAINIVWLLPLAYLANNHRAWGAELAFLANLPLVVLVSLLGAGKEKGQGNYGAR